MGEFGEWRESGVETFIIIKTVCISISIFNNLHNLR